MDGTFAWLLTCFLTLGSFPSLSLQTIAHMQRTSQNQRCVWVGDTKAHVRHD